LPEPWRRATEAYPINGFKNPEFQWVDKKQGLAEKDKQDIGDKKIEEHVHGFINADNSMHPTPYPRVEHSINGVHNPDFQWVNKSALAEKDKDKHDIGDKKINEEVHGFVVRDPNIHGTPDTREEHSINGVDNPKF